jgi:D-alanine-D-alanine ligase-like ATP-grasp enzyme
MIEYAGDQSVGAREHYPFVTRTLIELYRGGELSSVRSLMVEPVYGHVGRVAYNDGSVRMFRNMNLGLNAQGASEISKDKGYTKYFLERLGYQTPRGKTFLLPRYVELIDKNLGRHHFKGYALADQVLDYVASELGYPCFVKPNDGSQGRGVTRCENADDITATIDSYQQERIPVLLVERAVMYPDYRVVVLRDHVVACYRRHPLTVIGNGTSTIRQLLHERQEHLAQRGRKVLLDLLDPRIAKKLAQAGYGLDDVPLHGTNVAIYDVANLSAGGEAEDYTDRMHPHWRDLCVRIVADMGLQLCGVDLACADIEHFDAPYSILETNAAPGLDNYAATGERQARIVRDLLKEVFNQRAT